ncbi:hypothetical protein [Iodobacter fluviatilis]|jgi:hypothetical protein|uniref:Uncharacterized protein n=1 Tax=Iodobacter fluviatilis TaxID=537 RepID=A0A7G3GBU9_9NEIS|nr:hypothetical protein [Iodobacter fluviatilis]QBC45040.1 hypothetical protein C1H71_16855 [Iodobacter fluviatilis]
MNNKTSIILQRLVLALEKLTENEIDKLADPSFDIDIKISRHKQKEVNGSEEIIELNAFVNEITNFKSREEALIFLGKRFSSKKALEQIARFLDIPNIKQDKIETLREKIVETTTGARIRSEAIQGQN